MQSQGGWGQAAGPGLSSSLLTGASGTSRPARAGWTPRGSGKLATPTSAQAAVEGHPQVGRGLWGAGEEALETGGGGRVWDHWVASGEGLLEARSLWMEPGPLREAGRASDERPRSPLLLHRVPLDSEDHQGSQEPPGKWYVCTRGWRAASCGLRLSVPFSLLLLLTQLPPPVPRAALCWPFRGLSPLAVMYPWAHLGGS